MKKIVAFDEWNFPPYICSWMLNILEKFLIRKGHCFSRLDGSIPANMRQVLVDDFNSSPSKQVFLISTRAGGLGLNLVSANRVVIFDPNWNPSHDLQAQDRSFRFGQRRHVVVFRLLAAGSLEELVYTRQVYKQQLSNIAVCGKMEKRYFEGVQDHKQFQGELFGIHNLFRDLSDKLFTSEIIELHEKEGHHCRNYHNRHQDLDNLSMHFVPLVEAGESSESNSKDGKLLVEGAAGRKRVLEELGIVYSHRNEHVVSGGPGIQGVEKIMMLRSPADNANKVAHGSIRGRKKLYVDGKKDDATSSRERKKRQFSQMANFMGMREIELSRWLLSASPQEREEVLQGFKKRRKRKII